MRAAMIGLGKLGCPCAEVMARYHDMIGYDLNPVETTHFPIASSLEWAVMGRDLIFVALPTPHDPLYGGETPTSHLPPKDFDYSHVEKLLEDLNPFLMEGQVVVLISTALPGTVRSRLVSKLKPKIGFLYNPYLIAMGTVKEDMVNPEMVIIGTESGDLNDAEDLANLLLLKAFYKPMMPEGTRYFIGTWDEAESVKIFYNTFISAKLALVNMIQDVAEANGHINVDFVTNALAQSTKRIMSPAYMKAGMGDGGACHPRDNIALRSLSEKLGLGYDLFGSIMESREVQAKNMATAALRYGENVVILGKAYKPGVPYTAGSYSLLVGHYIEELGGKVFYYDPNTGDTTIPDVDPANTVYLIGYWEQWVKEFEIPPESVVFDPWRKCSKDIGKKVVHYGNTR